MLRYYKSRFNSRKWKIGFVKAVQGTRDHTVRDRLKEVKAPTLLVTGAQDRICCPETAEEAARLLPEGHFLKLKKCGHVPQIEQASKINHLVVHFLSSPQPTARPSWTQLLTRRPNT
jgi:pimeloyl-ACP methyl ester carboxylesterase